MKYAIDLSRHEMRTFECYADTPHAAVDQARHALPGYTVNAATELGEGDAEVRCLNHIAACEGCGVAIFEGEKCAVSEDAHVCAKCMEGADRV